MVTSRVISWIQSHWKKPTVSTHTWNFWDFSWQLVTKIMGKKVCRLDNFLFLPCSPLNKKKLAKRKSSKLMHSQHCIEGVRGFLRTLFKIPIIFCHWLQLSVTPNLNAWNFVTYSILFVTVTWDHSIEYVLWSWLNKGLVLFGLRNLFILIWYMSHSKDT